MSWKWWAGAVVAVGIGVAILIGVANESDRTEIGGDGLQISARAQFLVTDPQGRRTGFDGFNTFDEIPPGHTYGPVSVANDDDPSGEPSATVYEFDLSDPLDGTYRVTLVGDAAATTISTVRFSANDANYDFSSVSDVIELSPNETHTYTLRYSSTDTPGNQITVQGLIRRQ